ncbi:MAG: ABC transporter permease subunit [Acidimicrobiales bacterium]
MTIQTAPGAAGASASVAPAGAGRGPAPRAARFSDVVRSEWTKIRTVRSTYFALGAAILLSVGLGALIGLAVGNHYQNNGRFRGGDIFDPTSVSFYGMSFGQLAIAVLGVLVVTSEYATGMIRTTLQAMPRRGWVLAAKAGVFAAVALVVGEVLAFAAFLVVQPILHGQGAPSATLGQPLVLRAVFGAGLYLTGTGLLALGLGALVRHTAGAITVVVAVFFVLPGVSNALPTSIQQWVQEFLPTDAGQQVASVVRGAHTLPAWAGLGVLCAYAAVVLGIAYVLLQRRDA